MLDALVQMLMWAKIPRKWAQIIVFFPTMYLVGWTSHKVYVAGSAAFTKIDMLDSMIRQDLLINSQIKANQTVIIEHLITVSAAIEETHKKDVEISQQLSRAVPNTELIAKLKEDMEKLLIQLPHYTFQRDTVKSVIYVVPKNPKNHVPGL